MTTVTLSQHESMRLFRLLAAHQTDAIVLYRLRGFMEKLAVWPEEWDQLCTKDRTCRQNPDGCRHRDREFTINKATSKVINEILSTKHKANQLTADHLSLVEKFSPDLLPKTEVEGEEV